MERGRIQELPKFFDYPLLNQQRIKLQTSNLAGIFTGSIRTKSPLKIWEKRERGRIQGLPKFSQYPLLSQEGQSYELRIVCTHILIIDRNKSPSKISGKVAVGIVRTLEIFQGTHILGASRGRLCDSSAFLLDVP